MAVIGFHASHEQIGPAQLLRDVQHAERAGFQGAMCSDHIEPWSARQGHSGFAFSWLGAALATTRLRFGVVNAPGQRYHPAVVAHAAATLGCMFPGRFWIALGSGENMNEHITGDPWPPKEERQARLEESVDVIRRLLDGEEVTHRGLVRVDRARVWDLPDPTPALVAPAVTAETAARSARWADGLITVHQDHATLREVLAAYRSRGGHGKAVLQVHLSWAESDDEAIAIAHDQWRSGAVPHPRTWDVATAAEFDEAGRDVTEEQVRATVLVSPDPEQHAAWLQEFIDLGFDELYLHHVGKEQSGFIETFGRRVIPALLTTENLSPADEQVTY
ncbi:TIGR03885 family FMN-dependent LLM class oxidoreductase [Sinomonas mesophila]|uniref:TIGR03885 family FMN-dependent LLM class oxidoreductase n=1 Tax=Sinomonas mesophila TaxID=1531955 RepID=UPI0009845E9A|nr:TIGR03885 family FMN-dependent LLM class oxidoreductase [Sinomonas mesophila]